MDAEKIHDPEDSGSVKSTATFGNGSIEHLGLSEAERRRVIWKLDCCIAPIMAMFYLLSFLVSVYLHRLNISDKLSNNSCPSLTGSCQYR